MGQPWRGDLLEVNGRAVHVLQEGAGPPVVLLHGTGSLGQELLAVFAPYCPGFRLIAPDRPGYGWSDGLDGDAGPVGQAQWLDGVFDALALKRAHLVAHSLAAGPALAFAAMQPSRLSGLLLIAPFCRPTPHAAMPFLRLATAPLLGPVLRATLVPAIAPLVGPAKLAAIMRPDPVPAYLETFPFVHAASDAAIVTMAAELRAFNDAMQQIEAEGPLRVPIGVIGGEEDTIADMDWHLPWLTRLAPGTTVTALPDTGHSPHHTRPVAVADALRRLADA